MSDNDVEDFNQLDKWQPPVNIYRVEYRMLCGAHGAHDLTSPPIVAGSSAQAELALAQGLEEEGYDLFTLVSMEAHVMYSLN